jgi:protein arginine kinase activator
MKRCSACGERDSVIELSHVEDGEVKQVPLCAKCAAEKGIQTPAAQADTPLGSLLAALSGEGFKTVEKASEAPCPHCGATLEDFRQSGRLGCEVCYQAFGDQLRELLRRLHGSTTHTGKSHEPPGAGGEGGGESDAETTRLLRQRLSKAIAAEQFELAAELRDRLKGMS